MYSFYGHMRAHYWTDTSLKSFCHSSLSGFGLYCNQPLDGDEDTQWGRWHERLHWKQAKQKKQTNHILISLKTEKCDLMCESAADLLFPSHLSLSSVLLSPLLGKHNHILLSVGSPHCCTQNTCNETFPTTPNTHTHRHTDTSAYPTYSAHILQHYEKQLVFSFHVAEKIYINGYITCDGI